MHDFNFYRKLLLRSPGGGPESYTLDVEKILANELFKSAVSIASPAFYEKITRGKVHDARSLITLRRYYNRFCFRPTPFGLFAGISLVGWSSSTSVPEKRPLSLYVSADQHLSQVLGNSFQPGQNDQLEPNPTLYCIQREFRFVYMDTNVNTGKRQYLLQATDKTSTLARLIKYSKNGRSKRDLLELIQRDSHCSYEEAEEYLAFLTDGQVLLSKKRPAITGSPDTLDEFPEAGRVYDTSAQIISDLQEAAKRSIPGILQEGQPLLNAICFREGATCRLNARLRESLNDGLWAIMQLTPALQVPQLKRFAEKFNELFEGRTIPLLELLDPETGITYGASGQDDGNRLLETLNIDRKHPPDVLHEWTAAHRFLLDAWHEQIDSGNMDINLSETGLKGLNPGKTEKGSAGFGILFRTTADQVWIESAGGYHTNALIGRFTLASNAIKDAAIEMAAHEQRLNPGVLFAEILHLTDFRTDNVNRREHILEMEIPVTASSSVSKNLQIPLSDLLVCVQNGQVLLKSAKHGSYVMPRQSSAYNQAVNDLPLFRFLADLPYQYAAPLRTVDLSEFFPGLAHYPRVTYKRSVLSPAKWILNADEIDQLTKNHLQIAELKKKRKIPDLFLLAEGDQQLLFDSRSVTEVEFFTECIRRHSRVLLQEVPVCADTGAPVCEQFNAFVLPVNPLRLPGMPDSSPPGRKNKRKFIPGSEWLYLKIYTSRLGANTILRQISPFLKKRLRQADILKWFFVRYDDHAPHLRLRFLIDPAKLGQVLSEIHGLFGDKAEQNIIREFQVDTYCRELERYGVSNFDDVEDHFYASSMLILQYLAAQTQPSADHLLFAIAVTNALSVTAFPCEEKRINYYELRYQQFKSEFSDDKIHVAFDQQYRLLKGEIDMLLNDPTYFKARRLNKRFVSCLRTFGHLLKKADQAGTDRQYLVSSLIHMHLNRLFPTESRTQEMTVFYFLSKYSRGIRAKREHEAKGY